MAVPAARSWATNFMMTIAFQTNTALDIRAQTTGLVHDLLPASHVILMDPVIQLKRW